MQDFTTINKYNCIVLRYCLGYLGDDDLVQFLQKLGTMLSKINDASQRLCQKESFIIVQDQIIPEDKTEWEEYDQRIRRGSTIQMIFERAGLECVKQIGPESLNRKFDSVKMWALYPRSE